MQPKALIELWIKAFNQGNADIIASFYADNAVNHQVANEPIEGKAAIRAMFAAEFANAEMVCITENIFEDDNWFKRQWFLSDREWFNCFSTRLLG